MSMPVIKQGTISREVAVGDIIKSIAMEESSLSHILNAESEKLETVINNPATTVDELLAVNRSVKYAVDNVIRLEMTLKSKLELFQDMICQIG